MQVVQGHFLQAFGIDLFGNFFNFRFTSSRYSANCSLLLQISSTLVYLKSWRLTNWSWFSPSFYHFLFRTRYYRPVIVTGCRWIYIIFNMLGGLGAKLAVFGCYIIYAFYYAIWKSFLIRSVRICLCYWFHPARARFTIPVDLNFAHVFHHLSLR